MATTAPAHYIRSIHTSFTAAHPHSSWTQSRAAHSHILGLSNPTQTSKYPPGLGASTGRKRSASVRVAPPAYAQQRMQPRQIKFDPFADEPDVPAIANVVLYNSPYPPTSRASTTRPPSVPYTIQIPPAAPADIQRHYQHQQQYRHQTRLSQPRPSPSPSPSLPPPPRPPVQRVPTPAVLATPNATASALREREARSKIVAGILLNRVHAVGKPMRRRPSIEQPRAYVPSNLSTCISVEA